MASIQLLDQNTINKIAAGEVVERPASVIKELVENAIDAGASSVTVEVKDGGLKMIRITDNGSGIHRDEVRTAFLRHSTSKIRQASDLIDIHSLGFRGEALASIAAVSMVELLTKQAEDVTGIRYVIEGGKELSYEEIGCPTGTSFIIKDLFYNTPARLKFMKTPSTELGYISDLLNKLAMGYPEIGIKLISNGKVKLHTTGNGKLRDAIFAVYGKEIARNTIEINHGNDRMTISGFIGKPTISRGNRSYENYYINGRYIKSKVIEKAIEDGYKSKLMQHRYPFVTFHMEILAKDVDVNVHPTKMDVRFMEEAEVYRLVFEGVNKALNQKELIPKVSVASDKEKKTTEKLLKDVAKAEQKESLEKSNKKPERYEPFETKVVNMSKVEVLPKADPDVIFGKSKAFAPKIDLMTATTKSYREAVDLKPMSVKEEKAFIVGQDEVDAKDTDNYKGEQVALDQKVFLDSTAAKSHKIVGQLFNTYWVVELEDEYYMIDQHAAHEKVLYERMVNKIKNKSFDGQRLLRPVVVDVSIKEMSRYESNKQLFNDIGFEVELFGESSLIIRSVPFVFDKILDASQFLHILDHLEDNYSEDKNDHLLHDIATMSCKAAVKGNDRLSTAEYVQLIDDLLTLDEPFHCPHGRPTIIAMSKYELEKKFKRIQ